MDFFGAMQILGSGLTAQRARMNLVASNLANAHTTRGVNGGPYRRQDPVFAARSVAGRFGLPANDPVARAAATVEMTGVRADPSPPRRVYDPGHPDADPQGYVAMPNVNVVEEMVNLMTASSAYEASVTAMQTVKGMARSALEIGR